MTLLHTVSLHSEFLDGDLSPKDISLVREHTTVCSECRDDLARLIRLKAALGQIDITPPADEYFSEMLDNIIARTISQADGAEEKQIPSIPRRSGRDILTTLIRLAAAITLLFASFYIAGIKERHSTRWAHSPSESEYVQSDSTATPVNRTEPRTGINRVGSPAPVEDHLQTPSLPIK